MMVSGKQKRRPVPEPHAKPIETKAPETPAAATAMKTEEHETSIARARLKNEFEYVIVGGGVAAEASAFELKERRPDAEVWCLCFSHCFLSSDSANWQGRTCPVSATTTQ